MVIKTRGQTKSYFKERFSPLFDEFYQLPSTLLLDYFLTQGTVLQDDSEHPRCFLHIKERLEQETYDNVKQVVDDMKRITRDIPIGEIEASIAAKDVELYIERTIEPIEDAEGLLELYQLERTTPVRLDAKRSLGQEGSLVSDQFHYSSHLDRLKMSLRWPLPGVPKYINPNLIVSANLSREGTRTVTPYTISEDSNTDQGNIPRNHSEKTFEIEGSKYEIGVTSWPQVFKFSICIKGDNEVNRLEFVSTHVDRFLKSKYNPMRNVLGGPSVCIQKLATPVQSVRGIEQMLSKSLYDLIEKLIETSLDDYKYQFLTNFEKIIKERPYIYPPEAKDATKFANFLASDEQQPSFLGLTCKPVSKIAYYTSVKDGFNIKLTMPVIFTGIVEVKYITFKLGQCIEDLKVLGRWNKDIEIEQERRTRIKEVENTLFKYTTYCVHLGCSRYVLTDYNGFLFVQLKFAKDMAPDGYGTCLGEVGQYIKAHYSYFGLDEPYIRLYFGSFFTLNDEYVEEIKEFRQLIRGLLKETENNIKIQQAQSIAKEVVASSLFDSKTQSNGTLVFDKVLLKRPSYVNLCDVITALVAIGPHISQVVKVDTFKFCKQIFEANKVVKSGLPQYSILKVYDPFQGELLAYDAYEGQYYSVTYTYQQAMNFMSCEMMAYCKLSKYIGDFLPQVFAYGRLTDLYPGVGEEVCCRLCGGYIMMEQKTRARYYPVTKEYFNNKILRLYRAMHELNVIHGDVKPDNTIITPNGEFFIIDFSHCQFTESGVLKKAELNRVYKEYEQTGWSSD